MDIQLPNKGQKLTLKRDPNSVFEVYEVDSKQNIIWICNIHTGITINITPEQLDNFILIKEESKQEDQKPKSKCYNDDYYYKKLFEVKKEQEKELNTEEILNKLFRCKHEFLNIEEITVCCKCYEHYGKFKGKVVINSMNGKKIIDDFMIKYHKSVEEKSDLQTINQNFKITEKEDKVEEKQSESNVFKLR